ncbi:MAG: DUF1365 domain-containing protein, partial [Planctomycetaceae bacterium]|nr:DUF1365 domain-containing protein [Planctomycetaceae bacterium]
GSRPTGPVCLLTNLRYFGYILNPISLYYCFDADGLRVQTVVAEVTNTPWGERHCYVISGPEQKSIRVWRTTTNKDLHVSPFLPMDMTYHWRLSTPGGRLSVHIENHRQGVKVFDATLLLTRRPITTGTLAAALARHPWMTGKAVAGIYWQALKLWWKGAPFITHPKAAPNASAAKVVSTPH